jgi:hypothetical protein
LERARFAVKEGTRPKPLSTMSTTREKVAALRADLDSWSRSDQETLLDDYLTLLSEHEEKMQGHDEPCYICGKLTNSFAGDPGKWPVALVPVDGTPGMARWHCAGCVHDAMRAKAIAVMPDPRQFDRKHARLREAASTLADFAQTAPGRLPEHVTSAIAVGASRASTSRCGNRNSKTGTRMGLPSGTCRVRTTRRSGRMTSWKPCSSSWSTSPGTSSFRPRPGSGDRKRSRVDSSEAITTGTFPLSGRSHRRSTGRGSVMASERALEEARRFKRRYPAVLGSDAENLTEEAIAEALDFFADMRLDDAISAATQVARHYEKLEDDGHAGVARAVIANILELKVKPKEIGRLTDLLRATMSLDEVQQTIRRTFTMDERKTIAVWLRVSKMALVADRETVAAAIERGDHHRLCGKYLGDNDGTCPQLTCVRMWNHDGLCDNVRGDE